MGIFGFGKTDVQKAAEEIKGIRKEIKDITDLGEGAVELKKKELKKKRKRIETIKLKYPEDKGVQDAKLKNKFQLRKTNQNKTSGNNSVLAGIQKKYVANNKNKKNNNNSNKVIVKKTTNSSSPTQMDRNKTKSLKSKTFASKQKAFNKKYRA